MKKIIILAIFAVFLQASYIGGLVAIVENEPITSYEIENLQDKMKISRQDALEILIRQRLEDAQIKSLNIEIDNFELENQILAIAKNNGLSKDEFLSNLKKNNITEAQFRDQLKKRLQQDRLYERILSRPNENINRENAMKFYQSNRQSFVKFEKVKIVKYSSKDRQKLEETISNPLKVQYDVTTEDINIFAPNTNAELLYILVNTPSGSFTPIFSDNGYWTTIFVGEKTGSYIPPFEVVEQDVVRKMAEKEKDTLVEDYFSKLRVKAKIEMIQR